MMRRDANPPARNRRASSPRSPGSHLLDVRVRTSTARRQRKNHVFRVVFGILLWTSVAAGTIYGVHAITQKFFLRNPEYNLRVVDTQLDDLMTKEEALRISGLAVGQNIFQLDLAAAERAFRQIDQIATVTIQRDWPDTVTIKLTRRVPVAWLAQAGRDFSADDALLLDATGSTMRPYRVEPEYWQLPVILAPDPALIQKGDVLACADLKAALDLLAARAARPESLLDIRAIDITRAYALEVIDGAKAHLTFSPEDPGAQIDRVQPLLENCRETGRQLDTVNLIPKKYTPVRFTLVAMQEVVPAEAPKKPTRKVRN